MNKPDFVEEEHLEYLDELRESGITNMGGAAPFVKDEFSLTTKQAREILMYWMQTFGERHK